MIDTLAFARDIYDYAKRAFGYSTEEGSHENTVKSNTLYSYKC